MTTPYGQPAYGAPMPRPHPRGVAVLVLGIIGIILWVLVLIGRLATMSH